MVNIGGEGGVHQLDCDVPVVCIDSIDIHMYS